MRDLARGFEGQDVKALQDALNYHIRRLEPLEVDGIFGPKTDARVREFQKSNGLKVDGIVGSNTRRVMFEVTVLPVSIGFVPKLQLTMPRGPSGIKPPRLIPELKLPGGGGSSPSQLLPGPTIFLRPNCFTTLPAVPPQGLVLTNLLKVPTRKDPMDPFVRSRLTILQYIDDLPVDSKVKSFLISKVPTPYTTYSPPGTGFDWGVEPMFDPLDPKGFGVKGDARFTVRVTGSNSAAMPNVVFGAWGDGSAFLNFEKKEGKTRPYAELEGKILFGFKGVF